MTAMTSPSQEVQAKAARYLLQGKVRVDYADQRAFTGLVTGTRPYHVMCVEGRWRCDCPSTRACAHEVACQAVWQPTAPPEPPQWAGPGGLTDPFDLMGDGCGSDA